MADPLDRPNFALPLVPSSAIMKRDQVPCIEPCPTRDSRLATSFLVQRLFLHPHHRQTLPPSMLLLHCHGIRAPTLLAVVAADAMAVRIMGTPIFPLPLSTGERGEPIYPLPGPL